MIFTSLERLTVEEQELMLRLEEIRNKRSPLIELAKKAEDVIALIQEIKTELESIDAEAAIDFQSVVVQATGVQRAGGEEITELIAQMENTRAIANEKQLIIEQLKAKIEIFEIAQSERLLAEGTLDQKEKDAIADALDQDEVEYNIFREYCDEKHASNEEQSSEPSQEEISVIFENNPCLGKVADTASVDNFLQFKSNKDMLQKTWQEVQILCKGNSSILRELALAATTKRAKAFLNNLPAIFADYVYQTQDKSDFSWLPARLSVEAELILDRRYQEEANAQASIEKAKTTLEAVKTSASVEEAPFDCKWAGDGYDAAAGCKGRIVGEVFGDYKIRWTKDDGTGFERREEVETGNLTWLREVKPILLAV